MIMNFIVIGMVLGIAYAWSIRGTFSAFIHAACTLVAGALAFGLWEPLTGVLIGASPTSGFFSFLEGTAGMIALVGTFAVSLVILRVIADKVTPNNIRQATMANYIGGGAFGLLAGVISAGVFAIGFGSARLGSSFLGYQPAWYAEDRATGGGSIVESAALWLPADSITAALYSHMSLTSLSTGEPLAKWHPKVHVTNFANRISYREGSGRNVVRAGDAEITSSYIVGDPNSGTEAGELLNDVFAARQQPYVDINGERVPRGAIYGYVVSFGPGAKEDTGQVILGNAQVRLLVEDSNGNTSIVFPLAFISQARASDNAGYGRWRFDSENTFIPSVGGAADAIFGFEFLLPPGQTPIALYTKNLRLPVPPMEEAGTFASTAARDTAILGGQLVEGLTLDDLNTASSTTIDAGRGDNRRNFDITLSRRFEGTLQTQDATGFELGSQNRIMSGQAVFDPSRFLSSAGTVPRNLRVENYGSSADTEVVQVNVSPGSTADLLSPLIAQMSLDQSPVLVDTSGTPYRPVGYYYRDNERVDMRYLPGDPINSLSDLPAISSSRSDQTLILLFQVSRGVDIQHFVIGNTAIFTLDPPLTAIVR